MASFIPQPPAGPCPDYPQKDRPGFRYVRRASLPPFESKEPRAPGIYKRTKSSGAFLRESPPTPVTAAAPRHTAKSRARAAFLEGERAKFDEMFPPLCKVAAVPLDDQVKHFQGASREASAESLMREGSKSSVKSASSTTNTATLRTLSYSEVARGVPSVSKHTTPQPGAYPEQELPQETAFEPEVPRQCSYSEVVQEKLVTVAQQSHTCGAPREPVVSPQQETVEQQPHLESVQPQPRPEMVQPKVHREMGQQQPHPATVERQPHPKIMQRYPYPVMMVPVHPMHMQHFARMAQPMPVHNPCCPPQQQCHPGIVPKPYCAPVVMYPRVIQSHQYGPGVVVPQQCLPPGKPRQKRYPEEDFETLLAKRKEEYARARAEKEKFANVLEELRRTVAESEAFIAKHPEQVAKLTLRKSVAVEEAYEAERRGDQKREFNILQAHLQDISFNKAQVVAELENEERDKKGPEEELQEEIEKLNDNDEAIIERTMEIVRDMLNKAAMSDEDEEEEEEEGEGEESEGGESEGGDEEEEEESEWEENQQQTDQDDDEESEDEDTELPPMASVPNFLSTVDTTHSEGNATPCEASLAETALDDNDQEGNSLNDKEEASETPDAMFFSPPPEILKKLNKIAGEVEEDILGDMAKFGRLMRLEAAHNGKSNRKLLDMLTSLLGEIEIEHEGKHEDSEESSVPESSSESEGTTEEEEQTKLMDPQAQAAEHNTSDEEEEDAGQILPAFTSTSINLKLEGKEEEKTDPEETNSTDEVEEDAGPILPAFTSTSINLGSNNSKEPAADEKAEPTGPNTTTSGDEEEETGRILPAFTSTSINLSSAGSKAPVEELKSMQSVPSLAREMKATEEDSKVGRKRVSFSLEEENGSNRKPRKRCTSIYARMSPSDLGDLVSSELVSDIMSYANTNSDLEDECFESSAADDQSVIEVKCISVVTTEKNKTKLRSTFAGSCEKVNVLSFTIKGEILLSTPALDSDSKLSSECACCAVDTNPRMRPTMASTRQRDESVEQEDTTTEQKDTTTSQENGAGETLQTAKDTSDTSSQTAESEPPVEEAPIFPITLDKTPAEAEKRESSIVKGHSGTETTSTEHGPLTSDATPKEKPKTPYVYRLVTPSIFVMPPNLIPNGTSPASITEPRLANKASETNTLGAAGEADVNDKTSSPGSTADGGHSVPTDYTAESTQALEQGEGENYPAPTIISGAGPSLEEDRDLTSEEAGRNGMTSSHGSTADGGHPAISDQTADGAQDETEQGVGENAAEGPTPAAFSDTGPNLEDAETVSETPALDAAGEADISAETSTPRSSADGGHSMTSDQTGDGTQALEQGVGDDASENPAPDIISSAVPSLEKDEDQASQTATLDTAGDADMNTETSSPSTADEAHSVSTDQTADSTQEERENDSAPTIIAGAGLSQENDADKASKTITLYTATAGETDVNRKTSSPGSTADEGDSMPADQTADNMRDETEQGVGKNASEEPTPTIFSGTGPSLDADVASESNTLGSAGEAKVNNKTSSPENTGDPALTDYTENESEDPTPTGTEPRLEKDTDEASETATLEADINDKTSSPGSTADGGYSVPTDQTADSTQHSPEQGTGESVSLVEDAATLTPQPELNQETAAEDAGFNLTETVASTSEIPAMTGSNVTTSSDVQKETSSQSERTPTFLSKVRKSLASFRRCDLEKAVVPPYKQSADEKLKLRQTKSRPVTIPVEPPREPLLPRRAKMNRMNLKPKATRSGPLRANSPAIMEQTSQQRKHEVADRSDCDVVSSKTFRSQSSPVTRSMKEKRISYASVTRSRSLQPATMEPKPVAVSDAESSRSTSVHTTTEPLVALEPLHKKPNSPIMQQPSRESVSKAIEESDWGVMSKKRFQSRSSPITPTIKDERYSHASVNRGKSLQPIVDSEAYNTAVGSSRLTSVDTTSQEPLYKPRSLPGTLGDRPSRRMRKSQSEKLSAVPKLPKL